MCLPTYNIKLKKHSMIIYRVLPTHSLVGDKNIRNCYICYSLLTIKILIKKREKWVTVLLYDKAL